jgi:alginate O-acetyltransferase complex protein AlgJ
MNGVKLTNPKSPVLLLGDSHVTVFSAGTKEMFGSGSGLPDALAARFFFEVDVVASHGDGIDQARVNLYQQRSINPKYPDYWRNKKLVVWVFSAREFTRAESWSTKIPVVKKKG